MFSLASMIAIELKLERIAPDFASFNCEDLVNGIVHVPSKGKVTVILNDGFLLGEYVSAEDAFRNISRLIVNIKLAEMDAGITYKSYLAAFNAGQSLTKH